MGPGQPKSPPLSGRPPPAHGPPLHHCFQQSSGQTGGIDGGTHPLPPRSPPPPHCQQPCSKPPPWPPPSRSSPENGGASGFFPLSSASPPPAPSLTTNGYPSKICHSDQNPSGPCSVKAWATFGRSFPPAIPNSGSFTIPAPNSNKPAISPFTEVPSTPFTRDTSPASNSAPLAPWWSCPITTPSSHGEKNATSGISTKS